MRNAQGTRHAGAGLGGGVRGALAAVASLTAVGLGMWAQTLLDGRGSGAVAGLLYLAAVVLLLLAHRGSAPEGDPVVCRSDSRARLPWKHMVAAVVLAALAFPRMHGNRFRLDGTVLWLGALGVLAAASCEDLREVSRRLLARLGALGAGVRLHADTLALLGILVIGAFVRLYRIAELPQEMGCDVPHIYFGIRSVLDGDWPIYFPSHPGREGLFHYLTAPLALVFGLSHTTIKVSSVLVGLATLPALYLLGKELYSRTVGLVAAYLLAISHWHVILSRRGLRAITMPLFLILAWLWLVRGLGTGRRSAFLLAGLFLGLGMYTYNAFWVVPGLVVLLAAGEVLAGRAERAWRNVPNLVFAFVVMAVVLVPLARYAYEEPAQYVYRAATRVTALERAIPGEAFSVLVGNVLASLLMFNVEGDVVYSANVPYMRQLGLVTGVFFVFGAALALWRWRRGHNLGVLMALGATLAPTALSLAFPHEVPNATRAIGALPPAMMLAALGLVTLAGGLSRAVSGWADYRYARGAVALGAAVLLAVEGWSLLPTYFRGFVLAQPRGNYSISLDMARTIDAFAGEAYIVVWPHWYDGNAVRAEFRSTPKDWHNEITELRAEEPPLGVEQGQVLVLVHPEDHGAQAVLSAAFPRGVGVMHYDYEGRPSFMAFYGER